MATAQAAVANGTKKAWIEPEGAYCKSYEVESLNYHQAAIEGPYDAPLCALFKTCSIIFAYGSNIGRSI